MKELSNLIGAATQYFQRGNLPQAELICRYINRLYGEHPAVYVLLGKIALATGLYDFAETYLRRAAEVEPGDREARESLAIARARKEQDRARQAHGGNENGSAGGKPRFLLIKAWGYGFWSDMDHVLGQLLLADITGRVPVVHWGDNSLFKDADRDNAFEAFFVPVSTYSLEDVRRLSSSFFPPKWSRANLQSNNVNKWDGPYSRIAGFLLLDRSEDAVVSDFHTYLNDILPWIREDSQYYGIAAQELYRRLFRKYIRLTSANATQVEAFWGERLAGRRPLAVHVRGSDKFIESHRLNEVNESYHAKIAEFLKEGRCASIFLLTDSRRILDEFIGHYGEKLVYTECARTDNDTGVHYQPRYTQQVHTHSAGDL